MESISAALIKSLNDLGLSKYEARVYATLVLYDNAEAKEIIDSLSISKPSVYEALDRLAEIGLAVKRISKPARYSAIPPEIAIDLLMDRHRKAADQALEALRTLEKEKVRTDKEDALWTIYGDANIEYKIRDIFSKAKKHIECMIGDRYLPFIENIKIQDIQLRLIVISKTPGLAEKLRRMFPGENAEIHVISPERFYITPPFAPPEFLEAKKFMNFENVMEINVDDEELVMIPPFIGGSSSVLNTRNKGAIMHMKMFSQMHMRRLFEGEEFCPPLPPAHKKKR
jgi:HTH-type transcriptional regulator, sugar sensing transcriptional regulator